MDMTVGLWRDSSLSASAVVRLSAGTAIVNTAQYTEGRQST